MTQPEFFQRVLDVLEQMQVMYAVVGSLASGAYGEPRYTQDIDIVVSLIPEDIPVLARAFALPEYYMDQQAARDALRDLGQFNIVHPATGQKVDLIVSKKDLWSRQQFSRRRQVEILPGRPSDTASPEDIILSKMQFYREGGSEKHLRDITGILRVQLDAVDRDYIARWADTLGVTEIWAAILRRLEKP